MKICMITSYPPDKCGISDYSERMVRELRKSGEDVMVISRQGRGFRDERHIERIIATKGVKRSFTQIFEELKDFGRALSDAENCMNAIKNFAPYVVHVQYEPGLYNVFFLPILLSRLKNSGIKSIVTLHGIDYFPLNIFHRLMVYGKPDKIIVHTKHHYNLLKSVLPNNQSKKIQIIPMGLVKEKRSAEGDYALFFGFLNQHKGVEELLQAFAESNVREKLVIVGSINPAYKPDVEYKNKIENLIGLLGLDEKVKFVYNFVPTHTLKNYIKNSMFVVFPYRSSYSGGQSQAIIDSLAFGKPLIVTKPAQGNLVNNENAIVINPGDVYELSAAIHKLINSKNLRKIISFNNRKLAKKLKWSNIAKATKRSYETI